MYKTYKIISSDTAEQLAKEVNSWISDINYNYNPIGQPFFANGKYHQAIGFYEPDEVNVHIHQ